MTKDEVVVVVLIDCDSIIATTFTDCIAFTYYDALHIKMHLRQ